MSAILLSKMRAQVLQNAAKVEIVKQAFLLSLAIQLKYSTRFVLNIVDQYLLLHVLTLQKLSSFLLYQVGAFEYYKCAYTVTFVHSKQDLNIFHDLHHNLLEKCFWKNLCPVCFYTLVFNNTSTCRNRQFRLFVKELVGPVYQKVVQ